MASGADVDATRRLAAVRARAHQRRSPIPVSHAVALAGVGFEVISEVLGAASLVDTRGGFYGDGWIAAENRAPRTYTSSPANQRVGVPASLTTRKTAMNLALDRLRGEARAVDADGVIAIRTELSHSTAQSGSVQVEARNVVVQGVAVRAVRRRSPGTLFTTSLSGVQVAAALRGGLVPVTFLQLPVMGVRHIDPQSALRRVPRASAGEVDAYTDVVTVCRRRAREDFAAAAARAGADTAVIDSMTLTLHGLENMSAECTAEVVITGTALASFTPPRHRPTPLAMLPLTGRRREPPG